jgi:hypothetical protein
LIHWALSSAVRIMGVVAPHLVRSSGSVKHAAPDGATIKQKARPRS